jgi:hypothetical protein
MGPFRDVEGRRFGKLIAVEAIEHTPKGWRWMIMKNSASLEEVELLARNWRALR